MFETDPVSGKILSGTTIRYPDEYDAEGDQAIWDNQSRSFYDAQSETWTTYEPIVLSAPATAEVDATITVTATLPEGTPDNEVSFSVSYGNESGTPETVAVEDDDASQLFAFDTPGTYRIIVSSEHHGTTIAEVTVNEPANG
jgi:hypothetical protein